MAVATVTRAARFGSCSTCIRSTTAHPALVLLASCAVEERKEDGRSARDAREGIEDRALTAAIKSPSTCI
jgi:hypothetical protein